MKKRNTHPLQVGAAEIIVRVVDDLKDENEQYRKMVMETIEQILTNMGATDIDNRLEEQLIDGILYAFQVSHVKFQVVRNEDSRRGKLEHLKE